MAAALVLELFKDLQQRTQVARSQRAGATDLVLMLGQVRRQTSLPQQAHRSGAQFPQIKLLGLAMLLIIVPAGAAVTGGPAYRLKTTGPIAGALVLALIDIALHQHHRMAPAFLPIGADSLQTQGQRS